MSKSIYPVRRDSDLVRLLTHLRGATGPASGEALAGLFGTSRAALQKKIERLRSLGFGISAKSGVGYLLESTPDRIDALAVLPLVRTEWMASSLLALEECGSTNDEAKALAQSGALAGIVVTTEKQTAGRGRRGRIWHSPAYENLAMSILLRPNLAPQDAGLLTLMAAVVVSEAIFDVTGLQSILKWPNDILVQGKKLCGILTEMAADPESIDWVVVGIGCNVNPEGMPNDLADIAISLRMALGHRVDRARLAAAIIESMEKWHDRLVGHGPGPVLEAWRSAPNILGQHVTVHPPPPAERVTGIAEDLGPDGSLLLRLPDGTRRIILAGDLVMEA